jgi:hypothetical protein
MAVEKSAQTNLMGPRADFAPQLRATYTNSTNFTVPSTVGLIYYVLAGGGGGGSGGDDQWTGQTKVGGGGGGGGGVSIGFFPVTPGENVSITIGAGGTGGGYQANLSPTSAGLGGTTILRTTSWVAYAHGGSGGRASNSAQGGSQPGNGGSGGRPYTNTLPFLSGTSSFGSNHSAHFVIPPESYQNVYNNSQFGATSGTVWNQLGANTSSQNFGSGAGASIGTTDGQVNDITSGFGRISGRGSHGITGGGGGGSGQNAGGAGRGGYSTLAYTGGNAYAGFLYGGGGGGAGIAGNGVSPGQARSGGAGGTGGGGGGGAWSASTSTYRPSGSGGAGGVGAVLIYY